MNLFVNYILNAWIKLNLDKFVTVVIIFYNKFWFDGSLVSYLMINMSLYQTLKTALAGESSMSLVIKISV